jgi:hypothetical protein
MAARCTPLKASCKHKLCGSADIQLNINTDETLVTTPLKSRGV